ncbi:MAG TPA: glycosyltransferase family 1 protein [Pyrinomonadaceae bacterium]|nr:glycosyltransferase family 1 protein [Pyrinomonadaceae bacterium]
MKVTYDISKLGESHAHSRPRTGLDRAVEHLAEGLAASPECEVSFSAAWSLESWAGARDYLRHEHRFDGVPLLSPRLAKLGTTLPGRLRRANAEVGAAPFSELLRARRSGAARGGGVKLHRRVERRLVASALRAVEKEFRGFTATRLGRADVFHSPLYPLPRHLRGARRFLTVHDLIPLLYPQFCVPEQVRFATEIVRSIEPGDWVICNSQATRNDVCDRVSIDPARVFVTLWAAAAELFYPCADDEKIALARARYGIPEGPYVLSINTLEPRKNIGHLVRCFARLVREERLPDLSLVLVGARGWLDDKIMETVESQGAVRERLVVTGYVADEDLAALYSGALCFAFPSFYEGFGLPALEAMQCGVPVITSNTSSLPEVVGDAGITLDPEDADGLCDGILQIYRSASLRESMSRKSLERSGHFSWEKCVGETVAAYRAALAA